MNKEFIPYEQALQLKELGFNEECAGFYSKHFDYYKLYYADWDLCNGDAVIEDLIVACVAPLYQQAFRWFREKYYLDSYILSTYIDLTNQKNNEYTFAYQSSDDYDYFINEDRYTYEEAELACLKKLIEIVKEKNTLSNFTPHNANAIAEYNDGLKNFTPQ